MRPQTPEPRHPTRRRGTCVPTPCITHDGQREREAADAYRPTLRACVPLKLSPSLCALACESRVVTSPSRFLRASSACESQQALAHTHTDGPWRHSARLGTVGVHTITTATCGQRGDSATDSATDRHGGARSSAAPQPPGGCTWTRPGPPPTPGFCCSCMRVLLFHVTDLTVFCPITVLSSFAYSHNVHSSNPGPLRRRRRDQIRVPRSPGERPAEPQRL